MSEYQYYEFRAVDRPLTKEEREELRSISTRAEITATSFTNTYQWGDLKGDPAKMVDRYFDAFIYVANWGTHRLMFRIPKAFIDVEAASEYCDDETLKLDSRKNHVLLEFTSDDEGGGEWVEGEGWMSSLIQIRADLMRGDLRALYIGWLASFASRGWGYDEEDSEEDDVLEPAVPPGLSKLSAPYRDLASFLRVDEELLEAAASGNVGDPPAGPTPEDLAKWIKGLSGSEKEASLLRFLTEESHLAHQAEMLLRFREATRPKGKKAASSTKRRTVGQLLALRNEWAEVKEKEQAEEAAEKKKRTEQARAKERASRLKKLAERELETWREVDRLIATKTTKNYDEAVALLVDLRDLARQSGTLTKADSKIQDIRARHGTKRSFLTKLDAKIR